MRIVLVGAGVRGRTWARIVEEEAGVELVSIVDREPERANVTNLADVLHATDGVIIATPPESHRALVEEALTAGKHVLCEKPLSEELEEVDAMIRCADEHDRRLIVGMNFRYLSTSQRIREIVAKRDLGALSYAQFTYVRHRDGRRSDLNDYPMTMPFPMLLEQSIHHFDLIRFCYGEEVRRLVADSFRPAWSTYENDCSVSVLMELESGARVNYLGTWTSAWNKMSFSWRSDFAAGVLLQGSQFGDLARVDFEPELGLEGERFKVDAEPIVPEVLASCTPLVDDSRALLKELTGELPAVTTARDHVQSLKIVQACIDSARESRWVTLP